MDPTKAPGKHQSEANRGPDTVCNPRNKGSGRKGIQLSISETTENYSSETANTSTIKQPMDIDTNEKEKEAQHTDGKKKPYEFSPVPLPPSVDDETLKRRAAEARAYALSGTSKKNSKKPTTLPVKPSHAYGRYPPYGTAPGPEERPRTQPTNATTTNNTSTNPQQHPHQHPYPHYPPPPHYYYPPPPSHPHAPPYPYYPPPPYGYHYPPPPPSSAAGAKPPGVSVPAPPPPYPPPPTYPYHPPQPPPANPTKAQPPKPTPATTTASASAFTTATAPAPAPTAAPAPAPVPAPAPPSTNKNTTEGSRSSLTATATPKNSLAHTISEARRNSNQQHTKPEPMEPIIPLNPLRFDDEDDDYVRFVRSLGLNDAESVQMEPEDDDEEDFLLTNLDDDDEEDEDDDEDDEDGKDGDEDPTENVHASEEETHKKKSSSNSDSGSTEVESAPPSPGKKRSTSTWTLDLAEFDPNFYRELEEELGGLEEEDLEAAVASLLGTAPTNYSQTQKLDGGDSNAPRGDNISSLFAAEAKSDERQQGKAAKAEPIKELTSPGLDADIGTPLRNATGMRTKTMVTAQQVERLETLLNRHYQTLVQQAVLAIQAAHLNKTHRFRDKSDFLASETADDLIQVLDASVGMIQDLDQNRKDAIRNAIQLEGTTHADISRSRGTDLFQRGGKHEQDEESNMEGDAGARRLTRAAFTRTLQQHTGRSSVFNVKGLHRLQETFRALDRSIGTGTTPYHGQQGLTTLWYTEACREMLKQAGADYEDNLLPGNRDLSEIFSTPKEYLGEDFQPPCSDEQQRFLRKYRSLFTSGEDNLVLRGVNLYGEKQWILIADRYLPDRSINNISQRYSKLCVLLYKAHGVHIDNNGNLETPPKLESVEDIDDDKVALIKRAAAPAILNVHRWSLEEDITLLKAVPLMGHMWAELGARLIPHRDRGHLRKRYQVLERRVKATVSRYVKGHDPIAKLASKMQEQEREQRSTQQRQQQTQGGRPSQQQQQKQDQVPYVHSQRPQAQAPLSSLQYHTQPLPLAPKGGAPTATVATLAPKQPAAAVAAPKEAAAPIATKQVTDAPAKQNFAPNQQASAPVGPKQPPATRPQSSSKRPPRPLPTSSKKPPPKPLPRPTKKAKLDSDSGQKETAEDVELTHAESSRAAVEELVNEDKHSWSQMSRIQEMMENEVESEIVGTLASRMSNSEEPPTRKSARVAVKTTPSILTSVLERASSRGANTTTHTTTTTAAATTNNKGFKRKNTLPTTRSSKRIAAASAAADEKKSKAPSALKSPLLTTRATRKTGSPTGGSPDTKVDSPEGSLDVKGTSPDVKAALEEGNGTLDGFSFQDLETRGASRSMITTERESNGSVRSGISANDLEVISALNSLSNSPALPAGSNAARKSSPPGPNTRSQKGKNEEDKSFFAKITHRVKDRDTKRKRKLNF